MTSVENVNNSYLINDNLKRFNQHKGSTFQLITGKTYDIKKYKSSDSTRPIKSAPIKLEPQTFNNFENASLFSINSKSSLKNYNYKDVLKKNPSLKAESEVVRRNLFRNYMKTFEETNTVFKLNEHLYDKNEIKNASSEIRSLISEFKRGAANRAFNENRIQKKLELFNLQNVKPIKTKIETDKEPENIKVENVLVDVVPTDAGNNQPDNDTEKVRKFSAWSTDSKAQSIKLKEQKSEDQVFYKVTNKVQQANIEKNFKKLKETESGNHEIFDDFSANSGDILVEETYESLIDNNGELISDRVNKTNRKKKTSSPDSFKNPQSTASLTSNEFAEHDDEKYYNRNKDKFMKNVELAHKSMFSFSRIAAMKQEKRFPKPDEPQLHTTEELNLNDDNLKKQLKLNRLSKILENKDGNKMVSVEKIKRNNFKYEDDDDLDDDDDDNDDEDGLFNKQYRIKLKKRQNYMKLLKYMYNKAQKNQEKIEGILNKSESSLNTQLDVRKDDRLLNKVIDTIDKPVVETIVKPVFCISIPFKRDNISNYEIFIPQHRFNGKQIDQVNNSSSSNRSSISSRFYEISSNNYKNEKINNVLPLNYKSLRMSGLKVIEPQSKSNYWKNYNNK
jgi:hypothetical protein